MSNPPALSPAEQKLNDIWNQHIGAEFGAHSPDGAMATMVAEPRVNQVPVMTGGHGRKQLYEFYEKHFLSQIAPDMEMLIDPKGLPIVGAEGARSVLDDKIPLNGLIDRALRR